MEINDKQFKFRYRLDKQTVEQLELRLRGFLLKPTRRNKPLSPMFMILLTLRFFATGSFQMVVGDLLKVDRATACRTIHKVCYAIAALKPDYIKMPSGNDVRKTMRDFFDVMRFPGILGAIDCTHIPITSPGGENAEVYRNRHGYFSLNVQAICDAKLRWQGGQALHMIATFLQTHECTLNLKWEILRKDSYLVTVGTNVPGTY